MFVSEIAETSIRGALGAFFQLFLTVGILFIYVAGALTSWVTLSIMCAVFPVLLIIAMVFIPESPTFLVKQVKYRTNFTFGTFFTFLSEVNRKLKQNKNYRKNKFVDV